MSPERNDIESIYSEAQSRTGEAERSAYLESACAGDPKLRARVEALLQAHDRAGQFLETPPPFVEVPILDEALTEQPGTVIGRYKLLEKIGEGGMAVVYMAEQTEPIRRKVALKIIKLGMDTRQVIARFEAERQALALMDHPSIAKVLDAGATETGRPYFVMELVTGVSITEYCDKNSLNTKDRLALFLQVCQAVQHAHQKGIIHRDLKPSNVMVTHHDGKPVPKVIDFGIAKAVVRATHASPLLTEKTLFTRYAHLIGTPAYMSPEQAELSDLDIDTRSDIYSLGVLLYELLTGTTPFSEEELRKAGYLEMQRVIREQEPVKPSTRIRTATRERRSVGADRVPKRDSSRLGSPPCVCPTSGGHGGPPLREVRGDLDWIVMKSLEKDRTRRYETASSLAEDIRRHLEHEPVLARGPSTVYRMEVLLRRHRSQVLATLVLAVAAVAVGVVLSLWNEADALRDGAILSQAREQYAKVDREAALETIKPILGSRHVGLEAQLLQATILVDNRRPEEAAIILNTLLEEQPAIAGTAHAFLARILWESEALDAEKLRQFEEHRHQAEARLPETAEAHFLRAMTAPTIREQLAALDKALQLDPDHYESLRQRAFTYYASRRYEDMADDAFAMTILRRRDPLSHSLRAVALRELGRYGKALGEYDEALALVPPRDPQYLDLSIQRCETLLRMGNYEHVIAETRACLKHWPDKVVLQYYLFCAQTAQGRYAAARALFHQIARPGPESQAHFEDWCAKHIFDTLAAGRSWHPPDQEPVGSAFLPMVEAEETYRDLSAKARRVTTDGFTAQWSPDGSKLAFSLGVHGYNGIALFDPATKETDLLIAPGKDPAWSPDGRYIAFVRDRQALQLPELAAVERRNQERPRADEEVWIMKADGTQPRRLAHGHWPSWSSDSACVCYHSWGDQMVYSVCVTDPQARPRRITECSGPFPSLSPDGQRLAYVQGRQLNVMDLASQTVVAQWELPFTTWGGVSWSPTGDELSVGGIASAEERAGLWVCRFDRSEPLKILDGQVDAASWLREGTKLAFTLGPPFFEVWTADLDPKASLVEALGPAQTIDEHWRELAALWTRRIDADPANANNYLHRAEYYRSLHEDAKVCADARRYWAALHPGWPAGFHLAGPWAFMHAFNGPFDCQFVVFAERQEDGMVLLRIAFGQKGRCEMKVLQIPMVVTSLLGLCLLPAPQIPAARADFTFGPRVNLGPTINSPQTELVAVFSPDGLELYFASNRPGGYGGYDIWMSKRASANEPWGPPVNLGPGVNSAADDYPSSMSSDGLTLYVQVQTGAVSLDLYTARRPTRDAPWGPPITMGPVLNGPEGGSNGLWGIDYWGIISPDGLELFYASYRASCIGLADIFVSTRATPSDPWGPPVNLGPVVNTYGRDYPTGISSDGLTLFIAADNRPGGLGGLDMYMTRRPYKGADWGEPVSLGPSLNTARGELCMISPDGRRVYGYDAEFNTSPVSGADLWMAPIIPLVDFNGDGIVDANDQALLTAHLGQSDLRYDIGPFPWGDGKVDANDLEVLQQYLGRDDPTVIACWRLDEVEGFVAADSAGTNDGIVMGSPLWQPAGGKVGGALQFPGNASFVLTPFVCDPAAGPFSVFAWVQGGAPGQVILAQINGDCWLKAGDLQQMLKTADLQGALMTELKEARGAPLFSATVITDGAWHRVGLVWDGSNRILCVDGVEVVRDKMPTVAGSTDGLTLGGPTNPAQGGFWTGLIDDVRIYNRAVKP